MESPEKIKKEKVAKPISVDESLPQVDLNSSNIEESTPEPTELEKLERARLGTFKVQTNKATIKYMYNYIKNDVEWVGANQAYLILNTTMGLSPILGTMPDSNETVSVDLRADLIEAASFFLNKKTGKGTDSASKLMSAVFQLQPAIVAIQEISDKIQLLKNQQKVAEDLNK